MNIRGKERRVSIQCSRQLLIQPKSMSVLQESIAMIKILKKEQKQIFTSKETQCSNFLHHISESNKLMMKIRENMKDKIIENSILGTEQEIGVSSMKVLEQLDVNRKQKISELEKQNMQLLTKIQCLEQTIEALINKSTQPTLTQQYITNLQKRVRNRRQKLEKLNHYSEWLQNQIAMKKMVCSPSLKCLPLQK